jgi:hypothetical protein
MQVYENGPIRRGASLCIRLKSGFIHETGKEPRIMATGNFALPRCPFEGKTFVSERRNHATLWLIDGVRSISSAEVFDTSALSCGLSLIMSLV